MDVLSQVFLQRIWILLRKFNIFRQMLQKYHISINFFTVQEVNYIKKKTAFNYHQYIKSHCCCNFICRPTKKSENNLILGDPFFKFLNCQWKKSCNVSNNNQKIKFQFYWLFSKRFAHFHTYERGGDILPCRNKKKNKLRHRIKIK